jgi:hypothetical protein
MNQWSLSRTKQCAKCPWRVGVDPFDIPNGYDPEAHAALSGTIAQPGSLAGISGNLRAMACHESKPADASYCIGWLRHQLCEGNNIALRLQFLGCTNAGDLEIFGEQHTCFEDTLPDVFAEYQ